MSRFFIGFFITILILCIIAFVFYRNYLPEIMADVMVKEELPVYIPKFMEKRIEKYRAPVNKSAEDVIIEIHKSKVTLDQILKAIDDSEEAQVYSAIDELTEMKPKNTDEAFDIAKKHFQVDFDIEVLREPFKKNVNIKMIQKGINQANDYRNEQIVDPELLKRMLKKILLQKEKEYNRELGN